VAPALGAALCPPVPVMPWADHNSWESCAKDNGWALNLLTDLRFEMASSTDTFPWGFGEGSLMGASFVLTTSL